MFMPLPKSRNILKDDSKIQTKAATKNNVGAANGKKNTNPLVVSTTTAGTAKAGSFGKTNNLGVVGQRVSGGQAKLNSLNIKNNLKSSGAPVVNSNNKTLSTQQNRPKDISAVNKERMQKAAKSPTRSSSTKPQTMQQRPTNSRLLPQKTVGTPNQDGRPSEAKILPRYQTSTYSSRRQEEETSAHPNTGSRAPMTSRFDSNKAKVWNRNPARPLKQSMVNRNKEPSEIDMKLKKSSADICIQANELEIMNPDMIIGDMKIMLPSRDLVRIIETERHQKRLLKLLKAERKFEPHALEEKEHLTDLKEFLESAAIKKRPRKRKTVEQLEEDRRMIATMDEIFRKPLPKAESITDITRRIKRKEEELLSMFDGFYNLKIPGISDRSEEEH